MASEFYVNVIFLDMESAERLVITAQHNTHSQLECFTYPLDKFHVSVGNRLSSLSFKVGQSDFFATSSQSELVKV